MQQIQNSGARYGGSVTVNTLPVHHINVASIGLIARHMILFAVSLTLLILIAQLAYPNTRALPGSYFAGIPVGYQTESQITSSIKAINNKQLFMKTESKQYNQTLQGIGVEIKAEEVAKQMTDYPLRERLVPFSFMWHKNKPLQTYFSVYDESKLNQFTSTIASENNSAPVEGTVTNSNGELAIVNSVPGRLYLTDEIVHSLVLRGSALDTIVLPFTSLPAINTDQHLNQLVASTRALADEGFEVRTSAGPIRIDGNNLIRGIQFVQDGQTSKLVPNIDAQALLPSLDEVADLAFVDSSLANEGAELDYLKTAQVIADAINQGASSAVAVTKTLPAGGLYYPATSKGVGLIIEDWKNKYLSADSAVSFVELDGVQRRSSYMADKQYFSASLFKALVAWNILKSVEDGALSPNATIAGRTIKNCLQQMIVISDSTCAEARVANVGSWTGLDSFISDAGVQGITMSSGLSLTASGYADFLVQLQQRRLLNEDNTMMLLEHMKQQHYREGIPAGAIGEVADKVGYQPKRYSWHDGGIVYDPNSTYVLVVLGNGLSKSAIAELTRSISNTLNR